MPTHKYISYIELKVKGYIQSQGLHKGHHRHIRCTDILGIWELPKSPCLCSQIHLRHHLVDIFSAGLRVSSTGFLLPKWNTDVMARVRGGMVFLISRATVFDQIYVFYLRSANPGISGPTFDDIYALEHPTKDGGCQSEKIGAGPPWSRSSLSKYPEKKPLKLPCLIWSLLPTAELKAVVKLRMFDWKPCFVPGLALSKHTFQRPKNTCTLLVRLLL